MAEDMSEPMNLSDFARLAEAYGGRIEDWPARDRAAAGAFAATADGQKILADAQALDHWLDAYTVAAPSAALQGRILQAADQRGLLQKRLLRWWDGLGLIGVGVAGVACGVIAMSIMLPGSIPIAPQGDRDAFYDAAPTVFGEIGSSTSLTQEVK